MKEISKQSNNQLVSKLQRTELTGRNMLYAGKGQTARYQELRIKWESIASELCARSVRVNDMIPTADGSGKSEYCFEDATC